MAPEPQAITLVPDSRRRSSAARAARAAQVAARKKPWFERPDYATMIWHEGVLSTSAHWSRHRGSPPPQLEGEGPAVVFPTSLWQELMEGAHKITGELKPVRHAQRACLCISLLCLWVMAITFALRSITFEISIGILAGALVFAFLNYVIASNHNARVIRECEQLASTLQEPIRSAGFVLTFNHTWGSAGFGEDRAVIPKEHLWFGLERKGVPAENHPPGANIVRAGSHGAGLKATGSGVNLKAGGSTVAPEP